MSKEALAWPKGHRVAVVVSVLLETWSEGKSPTYFPRTTPLPPGSKDVAGINWSRFGGNEGIWRLSRNLKDLDIPATPRLATTWPATATCKIRRCSR
jgi:allantoinase